MLRAFLETDLAVGAVIALPERESHHLARVLRAEPGSVIEVLNGRGDVAQTEVLTVSRKGDMSIRVLSTAHRPELPCRLTLMQAIPKGKNMEWILEKATELGAYRIVPLMTERTVVHLDQADAAGKMERWKATAVDAIKQCGSPWLPRLEPPVSLAVALKYAASTDMSVFGSFEADANSARELCTRSSDRLGRFPKDVAVWIGPEGDFSPAEIMALRHAGVLPMTMGPLVLRVETAALYALSVLGAEALSALR